MQSGESQVIITREESIGVVALNRPKARNAISRSMMSDILAGLSAFDRDRQTRCMIITGCVDVFAAGADIKELARVKKPKQELADYLACWDRIGLLKKPLIAAVAGYALGAGLELAMACDMIVAAENAVFGQPELTIGVIPGAGGTQRLTKILGKTLALEMLLTGRRLKAREALELGLINRVVPAAVCLEEAKKAAYTIAAMPPNAVLAAKEAVRFAVDFPLARGLSYERQLFYDLFKTEDQKEGMNAFLEKRSPRFIGS